MARIFLNHRFSVTILCAKELKRRYKTKAVSATRTYYLMSRQSEILQWQMYQSFDLNHPLGVMPELRKNRAITDAFEPGSNN